MSGFLQVVPDNGYIIHAVPADRQRAGFNEQFAFGPPVCRRIRGRDGQAFPNLRVQFKDYANDKTAVKPFSRNPEDFDINRSSRRICSHCAKHITDLEDQK
jgi:hypothetical protein